MNRGANKVRLEQPTPVWKERFSREKQRISAVLADVDIVHIGSTSIPGIPAKPIVDLMVGVATEYRRQQVLAQLEGLGYVAEGHRNGHSWLCSPRLAPRRYIAHVVIRGDNEWLQRLAFRDYLLSHPDKAAEYAELKIQLAAAYSEDLDSYTAAKAEFVKSVLANTGKYVTDSPS